MHLIMASLVLIQRRRVETHSHIKQTAADQTGFEDLKAVIASRYARHDGHPSLAKFERVVKQGKIPQQ